MIKRAIRKLIIKEDLTADEMKEVFYEIMNGEAGREDMRDFLVSLAEKGESVEEITAAAGVMRDKMVKVEAPFDTVLDTCGTGGGGADSFNVSTIVALVAAGAGVKVAKHGNRSYTRKCGSADILEHLGVNIDLGPDRAAKCIESVGMVFLFAPRYHTAMKYVSDVRKEIKRRTVFNILGPLCNPAGANTQLIGTFEKSLTESLANVLNNLCAKRAFVVYGEDDFDEISVSDKSIVSEVRDGKVSTYEVGPEAFGIDKAQKRDVAPKDLQDNIKVFKSILDGRKDPNRDMVLVNSAVALVAAGRAGDFREGIKVSSDSIDSGRARSVLNRLIKFTNSN